MVDVIQELGHLSKLAKGDPALASEYGMVMRESRMQGQLARPVWRGLGRNGPQQWWRRAPLPPYITQLKGPRRFFYLYTIIDVYSRYVIGWMIAKPERGELAEQLIAETCAAEGIEPGTLILHSDRGSAMRSQPVSALLKKLEVAKSFSRPYTPTDNPYSEAHFKTLKFRPDYPGHFEGIEQARDWTRTFVH